MRGSRPTIKNLPNKKKIIQKLLFKICIKFRYTFFGGICNNQLVINIFRGYNK